MPVEAFDLVECERLSARIRPDFCATYRQRGHMSCQGCDQAADMDSMAKGGKPPNKKTGGAEKGKPSKGVRFMGKSVRACSACGEKKTIQGRGMCGSCYHKIMRREHDEKIAADAAAKALRSAKAMPVERLDPEEIMLPLPAGRVEVVDRPSAGDVAAVMVDEKPQARPEPAFVDRLDAVLTQVRETLLAKNAAYGNSALEPVRVFSKADPVEQLRVRIDDKLSRLMRGADAGEDTEADLLGYLVLLRVARAA